jgi:neutral ceramidase
MFDTMRACCYAFGLSLLLLALPSAAKAAPCGADGQRACCVGERAEPCDAGLLEKPKANSGLCNGGNLLGIQSSGVCVKITPCGGANQRACCAGEGQTCRAGLVQVPAPNSGQCAMSAFGIQSSGVCKAITPCGGLDQRACCVGEGAACKTGFVQISAPNSGQCGNLAAGIQSSGVCKLPSPCGGIGQRACCVGEEDIGACRPGNVEVAGCTLGGAGCLCGKGSLVSASSHCEPECTAGATWNTKAAKAAATTCNTYQLGTAIRDITGPVADTQLQGYANSKQTSLGLHTRLWARAFVVEGCNGKRVAFVSADLAQMFHSVRQGVVERLRAKIGPKYNFDNLTISATHTHQAIAGYSHYDLMNMTGMTNFGFHGFDTENYDAIVDGIVDAVTAADAQASVTKGSIKMASGDVNGASFNRSKVAFDSDPESDRGNTEVDKTMTLLRFDASDGKALGLLNWFAVHNTTYSNEHRQVSSDSKGIAAYWFERDKGATEWGPSVPFVAGFAQANCGDVSPNIHGRPDAQSDAAETHSFDIANKQYERAKSLYASATEQLSGGVEFVSTFVDFENIGVGTQYSKSLATFTCRAEYGLSFMGGSKEDGVGLDFMPEGTVGPNPFAFWNPIEAGVQICHGSKPLSPVPLGVRQGVNWSPTKLPLQLLVIGQLAIAAVPFELTTVTGRRLRNQLKASLGPRVRAVVIAGLSNDYSGYIATKEEYDRQQYEGASTQYGPWTEAALRQEFNALACKAKSGTVNGQAPWRGVTPPDLSRSRLAPPNVPTAAPLYAVVLASQLAPAKSVLKRDLLPPGASFGQIIEQPKAVARGGTAILRYYGGHPRRSVRKFPTFFRIERLSGETWTLSLTDNAPETRFLWEPVALKGDAFASALTIRWKVDANQPVGTYRIRFFGHVDSGKKGTSTYEGTSATFEVTGK